MYCVKNEHIVLHGKPTSELRDITYRKGSHGEHLTCDPP